MVVQYRIDDEESLQLRVADGRTLVFRQDHDCYAEFFFPEDDPWPGAGIAEINHRYFERFFDHLLCYRMLEPLSEEDVSLRDDVLRSFVSVKEPENKESGAGLECALDAYAL